jgi:hypothetical protein
MEITLHDGQVIVPIAKGILVLTKAQFIEAIRAGKRYLRAKALAERLAPKAKA